MDEEIENENFVIDDEEENKEKPREPPDFRILNPNLEGTLKTNKLSG